MTRSRERTRDASGRSVLGEALLAFLLGLLLAVIVRRPQDLSTTVPGDAGDPVLVAWILAWPAHALRTGQDVWDANTFAPLQNALAFSDPMLGYLPFGLIGQGPGAALVRYNLVLLLTYALAFAGTWVLVRQLGLGRAAALVAATAFAFNPWRAAMATHLQVLSSGGIPLALAMLARGHGVGLRTGAGPIRPAWVVAGWATAAWQLSLSPAFGLQLAYLLAVCTAVAVVRVLLAGRRPERRLLVAEAVGLSLFLGVGLLLAQPYLQAVEDHPNARRGIGDVELYSATPAGLVTASPSSWAWGRHTEDLREGVFAFNEKALFPGAAVTVLAVIGLAPGPWRLRRRLTLAAGVAVLVVLALGTQGPAGGRLGYLLLYEHAPGWQGSRTPGRLVTTAWLGLALLAAHGVRVLAQLARRLGGAGADERSAVLALSLGLSALLLVEGLDTHGLATVQAPPAVALRDLPQPVLVLPSEETLDYRVMLWSTDGFPRIVNGSSGFVPRRQEELRDAASLLPQPEAVDVLRAAGVRTLLVLPDELAGTRYENVGVDVLGQQPGVQVERRGSVVVVRLTDD